MVFTNFGGLFGINAPRRAESTDSRLPFQRHDIDPDRRHNKNGGSEKLHFETDDDMSVSIKALHMFLENILKSATTDIADNMHFDFDSAKNEPPKREKKGMAAKAAGAYESRAGFDNQSSEQTFSSATQEKLNLSDDEIQTIYQLLGDLDEFLKRGLEYLHLEKGPTLLEMLRRAVQREKTKLQ